MGQSYVTGDESEMEVRDSTFELVLEKLLAELDCLPQDDTTGAARSTVSEWTEYWVSMPPGCKELDVRELPPGVRTLLKAKLSRIAEAAPAGSETAFVAQQLGALLS